MLQNMITMYYMMHVYSHMLYIIYYKYNIHMYMHNTIYTLSLEVVPGSKLPDMCLNSISHALHHASEGFKDHICL